MLAQKLFNEPEVYRIEVPFQNVVTTETNVYVVRDGDDVLVVDMGAPTQDAEDVFRSAMSEIGVDPLGANVRYFLTHLHFDHAGLVNRIIPEDSDVELLVNRFELRAADAAFSRRMSDHVKRRFQEEGLTRHEAEEKGALIEIATPIDLVARNVGICEEGAVIQVGRFGFQVIDLPGHTRGMQGLFQPDSGICFSGDQLLFIISPVSGLFLDEEDSMAAYAESMRRLTDLPVMHLYHSHGPIRQDFRERAAQLMDKRVRRLDEARGIVSENPGITGVDVVRSLKWNVPFASIDECGGRQQWLIYTQGISLLDHLVHTGRIVREREPALTGESAVLDTYRTV